MKLSDIHIRDPFVLPYEGKYYMYGTPGQFAWEGVGGFWCFVSEDLENWSEPIHCFPIPEGFWGTKNFWAPEVHVYKDKFYMFATFAAEGHPRCCQIMVADEPTGPFTIHSAPITPGHWWSLDGTLYVEDGKPYMVFCHEHVQIGTGTVCAIELTEDLKAPVGEPFLLFDANAPWVVNDDQRCVAGKPIRVTDGPFLWKNGDKLSMIWSTFSNKNYAEGVVVSESGKIAGPWKHLDKPMFDKDGGHGMIFETFEGELMFTMHKPNNSPNERPHFAKIKPTADGSFEGVE